LQFQIHVNLPQKSLIFKVILPPAVGQTRLRRIVAGRDLRLLAWIRSAPFKRLPIIPPYKHQYGKYKDARHRKHGKQKDQPKEKHAHAVMVSGHQNAGKTRYCQGPNGELSFRFVNRMGRCLNGAVNPRGSVAMP
jgi:hypothetical protein